MIKETWTAKMIEIERKIEELMTFCPGGSFAYQSGMHARHKKWRKRVDFWPCGVVDIFTKLGAFRVKFRRLGSLFSQNMFQLNFMGHVWNSFPWDSFFFLLSRCVAHVMGFFLEFKPFRGPLKFMSTLVRGKIFLY